MKSVVILLATCMVVLSGSGCATIVTGNNQDIRVTSNPVGVQVQADDGVMVETPGELKLSRNRPHVLVAEYPGAEPQEVELRCDLNGWFLGNILIGGLIGMGVDLISGAYASLSPDAVHFDFTEQGQARALRKREYLAANPDLRKAVRLAIVYERPRRGMTQEQLVLALGEPNEIVEDGKYEKYIYPNRDPSQYSLQDGVVKWIEN